MTFLTTTYSAPLGVSGSAQLPDHTVTPNMSVQEKYGGFQGSDVVADFVYFADVVFKELGQYVKYWVTFNEPLVTCILGFHAG